MNCIDNLKLHHNRAKIKKYCKNIVCMIIMLSLICLVGCSNKSKEQEVVGDIEEYNYDCVIVTFDGNGGKCEVKNKVIPKGAEYGVLPEVQLDGCDFVGWSRSRDGKELVSSADKIADDEKDFDLYAIFKGQPGEWDDGGSRRKYLVNGKNLTKSWRYIDDEWYWFDENGFVVYGWQKIDGNTYYFDANGKMTTGWKRYDAKWYYLDPNRIGKMAIGWTQIGDDYYYFDESGARCTGWVYSHGKWYYCDNKGVMQKGWITVGNDTYYLDEENGNMYTGWNKIGSDIFYFNSKGILARDVYIDDRYVDSDGKYDRHK